MNIQMFEQNKRYTCRPASTAATVDLAAAAHVRVGHRRRPDVGVGGVGDVPAQESSIADNAVGRLGPHPVGHLGRRQHEARQHHGHQHKLLHAHLPHVCFSLLVLSKERTERNLIRGGDLRFLLIGVPKVAGMPSKGSLLTGHDA